MPRNNDLTTADPTTNCDRCGRRRPADPRRLTVTFTDHTDATLRDDRVFVCGDCFHRLQDLAKRCLA